MVSAHKTVAVLGVIGRPDDMHSILDTETTATMDWLDHWLVERGGRRGRAQVRTPTSGLTYAVTRHGTSRAGDPGPHDHVLVANVVEMLDTKGGFKGLDSAALRDTTEAATMVGRLTSAARAVELGYAIEPDGGPSGNLRHWRIKGIPREVCEVFSKRADAISDYLAESGHHGPRARAVAARRTRSMKRDLASGRGEWHARFGQAAHESYDAHRRHDNAERDARDPRQSRRARRRARDDANVWAERAAVADRHFNNITDPVFRQLQAKLSGARGNLDTLSAQHAQRQDWLRQHPDLDPRLEQLEHALDIMFPRDHDRLDDLITYHRIDSVEIDDDLGMEL